MGFTDSNQLQAANWLSCSCQKDNQDSNDSSKASPHHLHTSTIVMSWPLTWKVGAGSIISTWHEVFWEVEMKLKRTASIPQVYSNKKSPRDVRWGAGVCVRVRMKAAVRGLLKSTGMAELLWQGGCLSSERVKLVPSSENNWPVPAPIHQSDSTWPRGNEWINKGEQIQCADEVEPAG